MTDTRTITFDLLAKDRDDATRMVREVADDEGWDLVDFQLAAPDSTCVVFADGTANWLVRATVVDDGTAGTADLDDNGEPML